MPFAKYWRIINVDTYGGDLELSGLQLHDAYGSKNSNTGVTSSHAPTSGTLANLIDTNTATTCTFALADTQKPTFNIGWYFTNNDPYFQNVSLLLHGDGTNASTTFTDVSMNVKTVTPSGNAQISTAQSKFGGSSMYFDGNGDYLTPTSHPDLVIGTGDFTVEGWINAATPSSNFMLVDSRDTDLTVSGFVVYVTTKLTFATGTVWAPSIGTTTILANTWTHIAVTRESGVVRGFVDGVLEFTATVTNNFSLSNWKIGHQWNATGSYSAGYIDDLRITKGVARYTAAFTPTTTRFPDSYDCDEDPYYANVTLLLHGDGITGVTTFTDRSSSPKTIAAVGNAQLSTVQSKFGGSSMLFDGVGDYYTVSSGLNFSGNFTIEAWIRPSAITTVFSILDTRSATVGDGVHFGVLANGALNLELRSPTSTLAAGQAQGGVGSVPIAGAWVHVAAVRIGTVFTLYANGVSVATGTGASVYNFSNATGRIGATVDNNNAWAANGYIDELRVTVGVARYTANFTPPTKQFADGVGNSVESILPASGPTQSKFLAAAILQSSNDNLTWNGVSIYNKIAWPGASTLSTLYLGGSFTASTVSLAASLNDTHVDTSSYAHAAIALTPTYTTVIGGAQGSRGLQCGTTGGYIKWLGTEFTCPGDWSVSGWVYPTAWTTAAGGSHDGGGFMFFLGNVDTTNRLLVQSVNGGGCYVHLFGVGSYPQILVLTLNRLQHVEIGRAGNTVYGFVDGVFTGSTTIPGSGTHGTGGMALSAYTNAGTTTYSNWVFKKGVPPHTVNFFPPPHINWATPALTTAAVPLTLQQGARTTLTAPVSSQVSRGSYPYNAFSANDVENGGTGRIYGFIKVGTTGISRKVILIDEGSGLIIRKVWSNTSGYYVFDQIRMGKTYTVVAYDHTHTYTAVIGDNLLPVAY